MPKFRKDIRLEHFSGASNCINVLTHRMPNNYPAQRRSEVGLTVISTLQIIEMKKKNIQMIMRTIQRNLILLLFLLPIKHFVSLPMSRLYIYITRRSFSLSVS